METKTNHDSNDRIIPSVKLTLTITQHSDEHSSCILFNYCAYWKCLHKI